MDAEARPRINDLPADAQEFGPGLGVEVEALRSLAVEVLRELVAEQRGDQSLADRIGHRRALWDKAGRVLAELDKRK